VKPQVIALRLLSCRRPSVPHPAAIPRDPAVRFDPAWIPRDVRDVGLLDPIRVEQPPDGLRRGPVGLARGPGVHLQRHADVGMAEPGL
jgi:hypothetical protein